jgi:murein DD-endopeptidase MepM/ murein hydrolase activator NlpD
MNKRNILIITVIILVVFLFFTLFQSKNNRRKKKAEKTLLTKKIKQKDNYVKKSGKIEKGKIIIDTLTDNGLSGEEAYKMVNEIKPVYNLAKIHTGNKFRLYFKNNILYKFIYDIDFDNYLIVLKKEGKFIGKIKKIPYATGKEKVDIMIENSLYEAILKANEKPELSELLASLYDYDIDFNRDLRKGDKLSVFVEKKYLNDKFVKYGNVLYTSFINNKTRIDIIRYILPNGTAGYYHPDGRAVRKMFLKSPLPFMIVTSRFGFRRHPVLGFSAKHNGVDLRARVGTKVRTTANGIIMARGYDRVRGRYIIIRHPNGYRTHYYHLSRIKSKIRRGVRVIQGEIIGYSGNTGRSTGPHLHYGVQKYGRYINPLALKSPSLKPIPRKHLKEFIKYAQNIMNEINTKTSLSLKKTIQNLPKLNNSLKSN